MSAGKKTMGRHQGERKKKTTPPRSKTKAKPVAQAASLTRESFSAMALGMSPAKPTFIAGP